MFVIVSWLGSKLRWRRGSAKKNMMRDSHLFSASTFREDAIRLDVRAVMDKRIILCYFEENFYLFCCVNHVLDVKIVFSGFWDFINSLARFTMVGKDTKGTFKSQLVQTNRTTYVAIAGASLNRYDPVQTYLLFDFVLSLILVQVFLKSTRFDELVLILVRCPFVELR